MCTQSESVDPSRSTLLGKDATRWLKFALDDVVDKWFYNENVCNVSPVKI